MNKRLFIALLAAAVLLVSAVTVFAGGPPPGWCDDCCAKGGPCTGCSCSSGGGEKGGGPVVYIRPEDNIGEYIEEEGNGPRKRVSFKTWADCMEYFGDAIKCSSIVTDPCESCMGTCTAMNFRISDSAFSCKEACRHDCMLAGERGPAQAGDLPSGGGDDQYGKFYYDERGNKKYSGYNDFSACWSMTSDVKNCVSRHGYSCQYSYSFFASWLCEFNDTECLNNLFAEYAAVCP